MTAPKSHKLHPGFLRNAKVISVIAALAITGTALGFIAMRHQKAPPAQVEVPNINANADHGVRAAETPHYTHALNQSNQQGLAKARQADSTFIAALSDRTGYQPINDQPPLPSHQPPIDDNQRIPLLPPLPAPVPSAHLAQQIQALMTLWDHPPQSQHVLGLQTQKFQNTAVDAALTSAATGVVPVVAPISTQQIIQPNNKKLPIIKATDKYYAHLENGIDTDAPSDILAMLDQGPCEGAELMGNGQLRNQVVIATFRTLSCHGKTVSVNAVALNDETLTNALPARIDHRYLQRIGVPALLGAMGQASAVYSRAGSTIVQSPWGGYTEVTPPNLSAQQIASAAASGGIQAAQNIIQQQASAVPPIRGRVRMNLPVLILFKSDVLL